MHGSVDDLVAGTEPKRGYVLEKELSTERV